MTCVVERGTVFRTCATSGRSREIKGDRGSRGYLARSRFQAEGLVTGFVTSRLGPRRRLVDRGQQRPRAGARQYLYGRRSGDNHRRPEHRRLHDTGRRRPTLYRLTVVRGATIECRPRPAVGRRRQARRRVADRGQVRLDEGNGAPATISDAGLEAGTFDGSAGALGVGSTALPPIAPTSRPEVNDLPSPRQMIARTSLRSRSSARISNRR